MVNAASDSLTSTVESLQKFSFTDASSGQWLAKAWIVWLVIAVELKSTSVRTDDAIRVELDNQCKYRYRDLPKRGPSCCRLSVPRSCSRQMTRCASTWTPAVVCRCRRAGRTGQSRASSRADKTQRFAAGTCRGWTCIPADRCW